MILLLALTLAFVQDGTVERLRDVQRIYIGSMGASDEAERFRLLLEESLTKERFTVVDKDSAADAILSGVLTVRVYDDDSIARATVRLKNHSGTVIWSGDFQPKVSLFKRVKDTVKFRADNIAEALRKAKKKDATS